MGTKGFVDIYLPQEVVSQFAELCGDTNPLHTDPTFAASTPFGQPIAHGILVSSSFSTIFGASIEGAVYLSQTLKFVAPVPVGSVVRAEVEVLSGEQKKRGVVLTCRTECALKGGESDGTTVVQGEAKVMLPRTYEA